jgi:hypothetical protein
VAEPAVNLARAKLFEMDRDMRFPLDNDRVVTVQFNPESLKVSFANQIVQPDSAGDKSGTPTRQFVGAGTTKLSLQLWFDVTAPHPGPKQERDVRKLTERVAYYITPKPEKDKKGNPVLAPPGVRFLWGSFQFDGMMDSLEENLEFFSPDGRPLRASLNLSLSQQKITVFAFGTVADDGTGDARRSPRTRGTRPLVPAAAGTTLQGMADRRGVGADWQAIATANRIENPRLLPPGRLIDITARVPGS